ncbi:hypothetical protein L6164_019180 [Bauhinia variegata]|uniref:Uncharacterized protein n=1 Tax=Bauhinia variegata TaxID=167791 RepID=A0ACB9NDD8_BAUVA|nr:hypothetical protein L6164_019180 [Bauhinia variegata]
MKRSRDDGEIESLDMADCLMLLSKVGETKPSRELKSHNGGGFKCKTCNRQFPSFQALGGHRASHKKPKLMGVGDLLANSAVKQKMHGCPICGVEFAIGQALGGHMRKHRAELNHGLMSHAVKDAKPVLKKSTSRKILCLDLNLTPLENDLKLNLRAPVLNYFV